LALIVGSALSIVDAAAQQRVDLPPTLIEGVGLDEHLGDYLPPDASFLNAAGDEVSIGQYLNADKPLVLQFVYHDCPMLCSIALESFGEMLKGLEFSPGADFDILTVSFAAGETPEMAAASKDRMIRKIRSDEAAEGWHFLVGDEANIKTLTEAVGFQYKWVESSGEYAHPATLIFVSEEGVVTRYLNGIDHPVADVRRAIVEASEGTVGTAIDQFVLYCFRYDPAENSYVLHASNLMKLGGMFTLLMLGVGLFVFWRRERNDQEQGLPRTHTEN